MRNSAILFLAAIVILVWFGSEAFTASEICATSCISLEGLNTIEDVAIVAILPVFLILGGIRARKKERNATPTTKNEQSTSS